MPSYLFKLPPQFAGTSATVYNTSDVQQTTGTTDASGNLAVDLPVGDYYAKVAYGYTSYRAAGEVNRGDIDSIVGLTTPARVMAGRRWAFFGDSITDGTGATFGRHFIYGITGILGTVALSPLPGVNNVGTAIPVDAYLSKELGNGGETSTQVLARFDSDLAAMGGPINGIGVLIGANDVGQGISNGVSAATVIATFQANIKAMAAKARALGIPLVVGTVPPQSGQTSQSARRVQIAAMNLWLQHWGPRNGVQIAHVWRRLVDSTTGDLLAGFNSDGIHPNNAGHTEIARAFADAMAPLFPTIPGVLGSAGLGAATNPLMTGAIGVGRPANWSEAAGGTGTAPVYNTKAGSGDLVAGQWMEMDFDGTAAGGVRVATSTTNATLTPGGMAVLVAQVEIEAVTGNLSAALADNTASFGLSLWNGGNTIQYATHPFMPSTTLTSGPVCVPFVVPTGVTAAVIRLLVKVPTGVRGKFRLGACDVIDLTTLGSPNLLA